MTPDKAITAIDNHLVWLGKRKMINQVMFDKLADALRSLAELAGEQNNDSVSQAEYNAMANAFHQLKLLLKASGYTESAIKEITALRYEFLEKWTDLAIRDKMYLQTPLMYDLLVTEARGLEGLAKSDVFNVRQYFFLYRFREEIINPQKELNWYKENYPYLKIWFERIDQGHEMNSDELKEKTIFETAYKYHLDKWT